MAPPTDLPIHSFPSAAALEFFLEESYIKIPGFHLKIAKKSSGIPSVSAADAVQVALCFGWIDGQANSLDADWYLARYTPRRAKSIWSQKNVDTVNRLMQEIPCRMRPAGIAAVEAAKADGRWERAYAGPATMTVPKDFEAALAAEPAAERFFEAQNKTIRYSVLMKLYTGAEQTRAKRVAGLVQLLAEGKLPGKLNSGKRRLKSESKSVGKSTSTRKRKASLEEDDIPTRTKTRRAKVVRNGGVQALVGLPRNDFHIPVAPVELSSRGLTVVGINTRSEAQMDELLRMAEKGVLVPRWCRRSWRM